MSKSVGIWLRVSTEMQKQSDSPEVHLERAKIYAKAKGWTVKEVYDLTGVSGKSVMEHAEAQRMINDIKRGYISGLIFSKISRLARNTKQLLEFADFFQKHNADLISIGENIDTSSPAGMLFYTIISAMATWEREEIASRVKESVKTRAKLGKRIGGQAQFGYKWEGEHLVINEEEAPIRKLMFELFLKEKRKKTVARLLNEMGYRTRSGGKFHDSTVKRWLRDPIAKGLRRVFYTEQYSKSKVTLKPHDEWFFHPCPAIVSEELWQEVNDVLDEQQKSKEPILNRKVHLFTKFIKCHCGSTMNVRSRLTHYKCTNQDCNNKIRRDDLEEIFKSELNTFLESEERLHDYFNQSLKNLNETDAILERLKNEQKKIQQKIAGLVDLHTQGQIPTEAFKEYHQEPFEQSKELALSIAKVEGELSALRNQKLNNEYIVDEAKNIYGKWDSLSRDKKREIVELIVDHITIGKDSVTIDLNKIMPISNSFELKENGQQTPFPLSCQKCHCTRR